MRLFAFWGEAPLIWRKAGSVHIPGNNEIEDSNVNTYNISLGIFGKTEALPDEKCLEITTQCGHALISPKLVEDIVKKIRKGKMTSEEGARLIVKPWVCGIVNPERTSRILDELAVENQSTAS